MPRKKSLKNLPLEELIREKNRAINILEELKRRSIETLLEINELTSKLKIDIDIPNTSIANVKNNTDFSQYNPYPIANEEQDQDQGVEIKGSFSPDGNLSPGIRMLSMEESTRDYSSNID